eukprot:COSAG06_NODE_4951_length_3838_cov_118.881456_1_plen_265_part_10
MLPTLGGELRPRARSGPTHRPQFSSDPPSAAFVLRPTFAATWEHNHGQVRDGVVGPRQRPACSMQWVTWWWVVPQHGGGGDRALALSTSRVLPWRWLSAVGGDRALAQHVPCPPLHQFSQPPPPPERSEAGARREGGRERTVRGVALVESQYLTAARESVNRRRCGAFSPPKSVSQQCCQKRTVNCCQCAQLTPSQPQGKCSDSEQKKKGSLPLRARRAVTTVTALMGVAPPPPHHRFFATTSRTGFSPILRILSRRATRLSAAA